MKKTKLLFSGAAIITGISLFLSGCTDSAAASSTQQPPAAPSAVSKELSISSYYESEYLRLAAERYEKSHEDVTVTINTYMSRNDYNSSEVKSPEKYMQIINTAFMSGKGDDIIDVTPLSFFAMADKKMLADLNEYIGNTLNDNDYYMSVLDAYLYGTKRYTVPLSFYFEAIYYNADVARSLGIDISRPDVSLDGLLSLIPVMPQDNSFTIFGEGAMGASDVWLAEKFLSLDIDRYINMETKEAAINDPEFVSLLNNVKTIADSQQIAPQKVYANGGSFYTKDKKGLINSFAIYSPAMSSNGTHDYSNTGLLISAGGWSSFSTMDCKSAINNNSKNKELAADFIRFLLSEEMQSSTELLFCPVNKKAAIEVSKQTYQNSKAGGYLPEGFDEKGLEKNIEIFNEMVGKTKVLEYVDRNINEILRNEMKKFYSEEQSAVQTAENLQNSLNAYLKEY